LNACLLLGAEEAVLLAEVVGIIVQAAVAEDK
jgi:hypothetical protein